MPATLTSTIQFEPTAEGIEDARRKLEEMAVLVSGTSEPASKRESDSADPTDADAARLVFEGTTDGGRSHDLLKALEPGSSGKLDFAELGRRMRPWDDGTPLNAAEVRACYRNVRRTEKQLKKNGKISGSREVIRMIWDDSRGHGFYFVSEHDHKVLQTL